MIIYLIYKKQNYEEIKKINSTTHNHNLENQFRHFFLSSMNAYSHPYTPIPTCIHIFTDREIREKL